jgi:hypothetical protein
MKNIFISAITITSFLYSCENKQSSNKEKDCCKKNTLSASGKTVISDTTKELSCKLTPAELQKRKADVLSVLKSKIIEKKELKDGYSFKYENSDEMIDMLTEFVKSERQCCDFFNFAISIQNDGSLWFDLTGPKDAKEIIETELGLQK